jgi:hypothetical protein
LNPTLSFLLIYINSTSAVQKLISSHFYCIYSQKERGLWLQVRQERRAPAFRAISHATVDSFSDEAIKVSERDDGKPGFQPLYHPHYYAAYVLDPLE